MTPPEPLVAGAELGGTKCIAILARGTAIIAEARWPTAAPGETMTAISRQIADWARHESIAALGLASFGPLCLDPADTRFGHIVNTPKPWWSGVDVLGHFADRFDCPIGFDTDVAGAALAEGRWGASQACGVHIYLTLGTGVGGAVVVDGAPVHGRMHPEIGHIRVRRDAADAFPGICPFHGDCIEGLVSGPAITARTGRPVDTLSGADPVWDSVAREIGELMSMLILTISPQRIVIGGGVAANRVMLLPRIHSATANLLGGYLAGHHGDAMQRLIVPPKLDARAGPLGAVELAHDALRRNAVPVFAQ